MPETIYDFVKVEESRFQTEDVKVADNWNWNFRTHVQLIFQLKNGIFSQGDNNYLRAFKNIMEPILNLAYWAEDIEIKDITFNAGEGDRVLSFLLKKYHDEVYAKENNLDMLLDEITESDIDYGGALVQKTNEPKPEVFALNSIAFCDQTDILGGPIGFKYNFSPSRIRTMSKFEWGDTKNGATVTLDELCTLAEPKKASTQGQKNETTGKNIEVYIVRGDMPEDYLKDNGEDEYVCGQIQIIAFYYDKANKRQGVTLYRKRADESNLKFFTSKKVYGRALGRGEGEGLLHPQIWTNWLTIHKNNFLKSGSKNVLFTDDEDFKNKNQIQDMENDEITTIQLGRTIQRVPNVDPSKVVMFENAINEWYAQGQLIGSAFDPQLGKEAVSGTTFRGQAQVVQQGKGLHERRRGQRSKFVEEIYKDFIINEMVKGIIGGKKFVSTLSMEELQWIGTQLITNQVNEFIKNKILTDISITPQEVATYQQTLQTQFAQKGNKHLIEILKGEFKDVEVKVSVNVASKQKDLANMVDKIFAAFDRIAQNPYLIKSAPLMKLFNQAIEYAGLDPIDFSTFDVPPMPTRRMTGTIDYADLATPPNDVQKEMLKLEGIQPPVTTQ